MPEKRSINIANCCIIFRGRRNF